MILKGSDFIMNRKDFLGVVGLGILALAPPPYCVERLL